MCGFRGIYRRSPTRHISRSPKTYYSSSSRCIFAHNVMHHKCDHIQKPCKLPSLPLMCVDFHLLWHHVISPVSARVPPPALLLRSIGAKCACVCVCAKRRIFGKHDTGQAGIGDTKRARDTLDSSSARARIKRISHASSAAPISLRQ